MNVELPGDMANFVKQLVNSGRFESETAAIAEGVRLLMSREQLRDEIAIGVKQLDEGDWVDGTTVLAELKQEVEKSETDPQGS